ncbi:MAG: hypothetical protein ACR2F1_01270 [Nitrososphaeraceae archaeon]
MIIKKSVIGIIVLAFSSIILTTGPPFQIANNLVENNGLLYIKYFGLQVYAAEDDEEAIEEYNKEADEQHDED